MQHPEEAEEEAWIYHGQPEVPPAVRRVKIAENVTEIPDEAFKRHQHLEEVILSSSVQVIGKYAFAWCIKLKSVLYQGRKKEKVGIPPSVKVIDERAFYKCKFLARLVLNEGLERIGGVAFAFFDSISEVSIPSTVKVIDERAFYRCTLLARLVLNEGLERIGRSAFSFCSLTEVEIPPTVKVIDERAFYKCKLLARLVLNEGLERIGESAFMNCESLTEVDFPLTVKAIDDYAFQKCTLLERLVLNEGLERIGIEVVLECDSLSHVRIPRSVNSLATNAFSICSDLISIELPEECSFDIDLSGCCSLVSLAGPISTTLQEDFLQSSKLGSLVNDAADLTHRLKHRFDKSPLNKLCYYQSYHHCLDDAMARVHSLMEGGPPFAATCQVDEFGMTPLHVLSLSQTTNLDMLLAVMDAGKSGHMVRVRDSLGSTPMEYLCLNRMPNSSEAVDGALAEEWESRKSKIGEVVR
eukprot:scaffold4692_cov86-Cylindrotheca_fusiformis.AAC.1